MSFLNLPVRTLVAACGLSLLSLAAHAGSFRGDAHAPQQAAVATPHPAATVAGLKPWPMAATPSTPRRPSPLPWR